MCQVYSKFQSPGAEGVDALSDDWAGENSWLVPLIYLICRTIFHLRGGARGVLVIPKWLSAAFLADCFSDGWTKTFRYSSG